MNRAFNEQTKMLDFSSLISGTRENLSVVFEFEPEREWLGNSPYAFCGVGRASLEASLNLGKVRLAGNIVIPMRYCCSRCGVEFSENLFIEVSETLDDAQNEEYFNCDGNKVDLGVMIRDLIVTHIPSRVLCKPDCLGLCPVCGTNLNGGRCDCETKLQNESPFAKLKDKFM